MWLNAAVLLFLTRFIQARQSFPFSCGEHSDFNTGGHQTHRGIRRFPGWDRGIHGKHLSHTGRCQGSESHWERGAPWDAELSGYCGLCGPLQVNVLMAWGHRWMHCFFSFSWSIWFAVQFLFPGVFCVSLTGRPLRNPSPSSGTHMTTLFRWQPMLGLWTMITTTNTRCCI